MKVFILGGPKDGMVVNVSHEVVEQKILRVLQPVRQGNFEHLETFDYRIETMHSGKTIWLVALPPAIACPIEHLLHFYITAKMNVIDDQA